MQTESMLICYDCILANLATVFMVSNQVNTVANSYSCRVLSTLVCSGMQSNQHALFETDQYLQFFTSTILKELLIIGS